MTLYPTVVVDLGTKFRVYSLQTRFLGSFLAKKLHGKQRLASNGLIKLYMHTYAKIDRTFIHSFFLNLRYLEEKFTTVNQHQPEHREGWMINDLRTVFGCVPVH
jgi:hypothetical protein